MTEKERITRDLLTALDQLPEIMIGIQQMLKVVNDHELDYEMMDDYTPLNRVIDLINIAHVKSSKKSIEHLIEAYTPDEKSKESEDIVYYDHLLDEPIKIITKETV